MATVNAEVRFAPQLTAWFAANPTKVLQDGEIVYCSDGANVGKYVIGDNSTALSGLTFYGGISSSGLTIGTTTITSGTNTRILYNNAGVVGEYLVTGTGTTAVLSTSPTFTTDITTPKINGVSSSIALTTNTIHTTTGSFCAGRSNPDRPIEVYSSTGAATMQSYSDLSSSYAGVYAQGDNAQHFAGLITLGSAFTTNGLYIADATYLQLTSDNAFIMNVDSTGNLRFVVGGSATINEKIRLTTTTSTFYGNTINFDNGTASRILATDGSKNLQFLDTATYPNLTELSYMKNVSSSVQTQLNTKSSLDQTLFTTTHFHSATGTFNNFTYYFDKSFAGISTVSGTIGKTYIQANCTLIGFSILTYVGGTLGSAENQSYYVRVNNTTDITLTTSGTANAITNIHTASNLNTNLNAGDYIEIKGVVPVMATGYTSTSRSVTLFFKAR